MKSDYEPARSNEECERIVKASYQGILVMSGAEEPYAVPMNHAYYAGRFYFHCAARGRKLDMIRANPNVVYVVHRFGGRPEDHTRSLKCHGAWESVLAYGTARVVEDRAELREAFKRFMRYHGKETFEPSESAFDETRAIVLDVRRMTARVEDDEKRTRFYTWER